VKGLEEMLSWVKNTKADQSGDRVDVRALFEKSKEARLVKEEKEAGAVPVRPSPLTFR
jgi:hypothetical protein